MNAGQSVFCLLLFSSLDIAYVEFFRKYKNQISSYSGENVHIFTPMIYDNNVIPDGEWQSLRRTFIESGIILGNGPSVVLFQLKKRYPGTGYDPDYIGAFALPDQKPVAGMMREFVSLCIDNRIRVATLLSGLSELLSKPNLIRRQLNRKQVELVKFENPLHAPQIFLSYSHADSEVVGLAYDELKQHGLRVWLDRSEISFGQSVFEAVKRGLDASDAAILFLSAGSAKSSWLQFEGAYLHGSDARRVIIPVVLDKDGKMLASELPLTAGRLYVDMSDPSKRHTAFGVLAAQIRQELNRS